MSPSCRSAEGLLVRWVGKVPFEVAAGFGLRVAVVTDEEVEVALREPEPGLDAFCVVSGGNIDDTVWQRAVNGDGGFSG